MNFNISLSATNVDFSAVKNKLANFSGVSVESIDIEQHGEKVAVTNLDCVCKFLESIGISFIPTTETQISLNLDDFSVFYLMFCASFLDNGEPRFFNGGGAADSFNDSDVMDLCEEKVETPQLLVGFNDDAINPSDVDVECYVKRDSGIDNTALTYNIQRISHMGKYTEITSLIDDIGRGAYDSVLCCATDGHISVSPLRLAINSGDMELIRCLIDRLKVRGVFNQAVNLIDHLGNNVLHVAFDTCDSGIINFLLNEVKVLYVDFSTLLQHKNMKDVSPLDVLCLYSMINYKEASFDEMSSTAVLGSGAFHIIDRFFGHDRLTEDKKNMCSVLFKDIGLSFKEIFDIDVRGYDPQAVLRFYRDERGSNFNIPFLHQQQVEFLGIDGNYYSKYRFNNLEDIPKKFSSDNVLRLRDCLATHC